MLTALRTKLDGGELSRAEIDGFMQAYVAGSVSDSVAAALLAAIYLRGMSPDELFAWTGAMLRSGDSLEVAETHVPRVDKHSTGGIGDKVSIALAPVLAACGVHVPMISGRSLGHTGGTLDKLEAIPGLRTDLSPEAIRAGLEEAGAVIAAQTEALVPADRGLYALRDATGLIDSVPLVASSILSKKLAEGLDALVLDVKFGSGAFFVDIDAGRVLSETMQRLAQRFGLRASVYQTAMDRPLGNAVGNALEIAECVECLQGHGPADLRELVLTFGGELLAATALVTDLAAGRERIARALDDGSGLEVLDRMVRVQGGAARGEHSWLPVAPDVATWCAPGTGVLGFSDVRRVGLALAALGGGRQAPADVIDPAVGLCFRASAGDELRAGQPVVDICHRAGHGLERARALLAEAVSLEGPETPEPLILSRIGGDPA